MASEVPIAYSICTADSRDPDPHFTTDANTLVIQAHGIVYCMSSNAALVTKQHHGLQHMHGIYPLLIISMEEYECRVMFLWLGQE